jgi:DNA replication protein DnaC
VVGAEPVSSGVCAPERQCGVDRRHRLEQEPFDGSPGACGLSAGHSVLFTGAIEIINNLALAQTTGTVKRTLAQYVKPQVLCIDELGYLPIDKFGADCLFQIFSHRYARGSTLITTNRVYKQWPSIFNNDAVLTSALLDRLLHHAQTVVIEGRSYRSKNLTEL